MFERAKLTGACAGSQRPRSSLENTNLRAANVATAVLSRLSGRFPLRNKFLATNRIRSVVATNRILCRQPNSVPNSVPWALLAPCVRALLLKSAGAITWALLAPAGAQEIMRLRHSRCRVGRRCSVDGVRVSDLLAARRHVAQAELPHNTVCRDRHSHNRTRLPSPISQHGMRARCAGNIPPTLLDKPSTVKRPPMRVPMYMAHDHRSAAPRAHSRASMAAQDCLQSRRCQRRTSTTWQTAWIVSAAPVEAGVTFRFYARMEKLVRASHPWTAASRSATTK